jgi:hypothetical protein
MNQMNTVAQLGVLRTMKAKDVYFRAIARRYIGQRPNWAFKGVQLAEKVAIPIVE